MSMMINLLVFVTTGHGLMKQPGVSLSGLKFTRVCVCVCLCVCVGFMPYMNLTLQAINIYLHIEIRTKREVV